MRLSQSFLPTLKETPADATVASHILLLRAGYLRPLAAGIYSYLPLFQRVVRKIEQVLRERCARIGAQEILPPRSTRPRSGRKADAGRSWATTCFASRIRGGQDLALGMTHEEIFTSIARNELRSYRQLPQVWYQIQS